MSVDLDSTRAPSVVLAALAASTPTETFIFHVVPTFLCPALDALPLDCRSDITRTLLAAQRDCLEVQRLLTEVDYAGHERQLNSALREMELESNSDKASCCKVQENDMADYISGELARWLGILWRTGVEKAVEIALVHKCLLLCSRVINRAKQLDSSFGEGVCEVSISDWQGTVIYHRAVHAVEETVYWIWRELAIACIMRRNIPLARSIVADWGPLNIAHRVLSHIPRDQPAFNVYDDNYQIAHWSDGARAAVPRLLAMVHDLQIKSFKTSPSVDAYCTLLATSPELYDRLVNVVRGLLQRDGNQGDAQGIPWDAAAHMFCLSGLIGDLLHLEQSLPRGPSDATARAARRRIVEHLSMQPDPSLRAKGLEIAMVALSDAIARVWSAFREFYPQWDDAWRWLKLQIAEGRVSADLPTDAGQYMRREEYLQRFVDLLRIGRNYRQDDEAESDAEDDSDSEADGGSAVSGRAAMAREVNEWGKVIEKWPVLAENIYALQSLEIEGAHRFEVEGVLSAVEKATRMDGADDVIEGVKDVYQLYLRRKVVLMATVQFARPL